VPGHQGRLIPPAHVKPYVRRLSVRNRTLVRDQPTGRPPVPVSSTAQPGKYKGKPIPLFLCGDAAETNEIAVTAQFGDVTATFNNGILSTQNLRKQLETAHGRAPTQNELKGHIEKPRDKIRRYLAGDILPALASLFERAIEIDGAVHLALYELDDRELVDLLAVNQERLQLILTTAGSRAVRAGNPHGSATLAMRAPAQKMAKKKVAPRKVKQAVPKRRSAPAASCLSWSSELILRQGRVQQRPVAGHPRRRLVAATLDGRRNLGRSTTWRRHRRGQQSWQAQ
jgi:hypothetical protein